MVIKNVRTKIRFFYILGPILLIFCIINPDIGSIMVLIGGSLNLIVMLANGCQMPVMKPFTPDGDNVHRLASKDDRLLWLADRFSFRQYQYSIGDILMLIGFVFVTIRTARFVIQAIHF